MSPFLGALACVWPLVAALATWTSARAQPRGPIALHWVRDQGAESCVSGYMLVRELEQLVELRAPAVATDVSIEGSVRREPERWIARLRVLDAQGQTAGVREVASTAPECAALTPSILLVLAWLIELRAEAEPRAHAVAPPEPALEVAPPAALAAPRAPKRWAVEPALGFGIAFGVNPAPSFGPSVGAQLVTPWRIMLALFGHYFLPDGVALKEPVVPGAAAEFQALQASLAICVPLLRPGAWALAGCMGGLLGARFTHTSGLSTSRDPARVYGGAINTLRLGYAVSSRWSLTLDGTGAALGREDRFVYDDAHGATQVLYRPPRFGGWCTFGAAARF